MNNHSQNLQRTPLGLKSVKNKNIIAEKELAMYTGSKQLTPNKNLSKNKQLIIGCVNDNNLKDKDFGKPVTKEFSNIENTKKNSDLLKIKPLFEDNNCKILIWLLASAHGDLKYILYNSFKKCKESDCNNNEYLPNERIQDDFYINQPLIKEETIFEVYYI